MGLHNVSLKICEASHEFLRERPQFLIILIDPERQSMPILFLHINEFIDHKSEETKEDRHDHRQEERDVVRDQIHDRRRQQEGNA